MPGINYEILTFDSSSAKQKRVNSELADIKFKSLELTNPGTGPNDVTTRSFVESFVANTSNFKDPVFCATTENITLYGEGVLIDGEYPVSGNRVLVKNQTNPQENGIYVVSTSNWVRAGDADTAEKLTYGACVPVLYGRLNRATIWCLSEAPATLGADPITFSNVTAINDLSNLVNPTSVYANLVPGSTNSYDLGDQNKLWLYTYTSNLIANSIRGPATSSSTALAISTESNLASTKHIYLWTGSSLSGGTTGTVEIQTGTANGDSSNNAESGLLRIGSGDVTVLNGQGTVGKVIIKSGDAFATGTGSVNYGNVEISQSTLKYIILGKDQNNGDTDAIHIKPGSSGKVIVGEASSPAVEIQSPLSLTIRGNTTGDNDEVGILHIGESVDVTAKNASMLLYNQLNIQTAPNSSSSTGNISLTSGGGNVFIGTTGSNKDFEIRSGQAKIVLNDGAELSINTNGHNIDVNGARITDLSDPVHPADAATKNYVDAYVTGLGIRKSCLAATTTALPSFIYDTNNDQLTATANGPLPTIDGVDLIAGNRLLVKDEGGGISPYNGIYDVIDAGTATTPWILKRADDYDGTPISEVRAGTFTFIESGVLNKAKGFVQIRTVDTLNTDPLEFSQFSQAGSSYSAGNGIQISGSTISVKYGDDFVNAEPVSSIENRNFLYISSSGNVKRVLADGSIPGLGPGTQFAISRTASSVSPGNIVNATFKSGDIVGGFSGLNVGEPVYASRTNSGGYTQSLSGFTAGDDVIRIGYAISSTEIHFNPEYLFEF